MLPDAPRPALAAVAESFNRRQRARHLGDLTVADALNALARRWWLIAITTLTGLTLGVVGAIAFPASFVSFGFLVVDARRTSIPEAGIVSVQQADPRIPRSEAKVLTAPEFLTALADRLKLNELPFITEAVTAEDLAKGSLLAPASPAPDPAVALANARRIEAIDWLTHRLIVRGEDRSYAITVSMESADPALSARVVNEAMKLYLERRGADDSEIVQRASSSISQRYGEIRDEVRDLEAHILALRTQDALVRTESGRVDALDLVKLGNELREYESRKADLEEAKGETEQAAASGNWQKVDTKLASPYLLKLLEQEALAGREYAQAATMFGPRHPTIIDLKQQLESLHSRLRGEVGRIAQSLKTEIDAIDARTKVLQEQIAARRSTSVEAEQKDERIRQFEDELKSKRELLAVYEMRLQQLAASVGAAAGAVRVGAWATPPLEPAGPSPILLVGLAGIIGLLAGGAYVILERRFGDRLESTDEIVAVAGLPVLGAVPELKTRRRDPRLVWSRVCDEPHGAVAESVRAIFVRIQFALTEARGVVLITSPMAGDGKTSLSFAMAQQAASTGRRCLLIDGDLFRAGVTRAARVERPMPSDRETADAKARLLEDRNTGLHILAAPRIFSPHQHSRALQRFQQIIREARSRYDLVIIDSPPVMHVSDAALIAPAADAVVMVASWRRLQRSTLIEALERIEPAGAPVIGIALSKMKRGSERRYLYGGYTSRISQEADLADSVSWSRPVRGEPAVAGRYSA